MRTLLLADDNITVQRVIGLTFANEDIQVVTCADGQQAMERIAAQRPDIVMAATSLPTMNGYDLARFIRNSPELKNVPVLLLSGAFENVDEARVVSSGASGVIEKPVEPNNVIGRVKELLGLKSEAKPAAAGRLITPAEGPKDKKLPPTAPPRVVTSTRGAPSKWEQPREQSGLEPNTRSVEDAPPKPADYLDTLDAAFDTLDQQLSGRAANAKPSRNPSGPLGQSSGAPDPRSPGRQPKDSPATPAAGNPVFEVDDDWFGGEDSKALADARAGRREIQEDLRDPELQGPPVEAAPNAVFEVDDEWFAEDDKARAAKLDEHRTLAAEMGIHEVELPPVEPVPNGAAPVSASDFDFGLDDIKRLQEAAPPPVVEEVPHAAVAAPELIEELPAPIVETAAPIAPALEELFAEAPPAPASTRVDSGGLRSGPEAPYFPVADDFAQLLAFEQGEHHEPPKPAPLEVRYVAPEITDDMLDLIATRVAERLSAGPFGEKIKDALTASIRDVTTAVAYEASERIVRQVAADASERVVREVAHATSDRVVREVASEASERVVREVANEATERVVREVANETSERLVREVASETSERVAREITAETSARVVREVVSETSERLVRDEIDRIKSKHQ